MDQKTKQQKMDEALDHLKKYKAAIFKGTDEEFKILAKKFPVLTLNIIASKKKFVATHDWEKMNEHLYDFIKFSESLIRQCCFETFGKRKKEAPES